MPTPDTLTESQTTVAAALERATHQVATADESFGADVNHLSERLREMVTAMIAHGDRCPVGEAEEEEDLECRLNHFVWAERAKHYLVLYRNVQLQLQTAALMVKDGAAETGLVGRLHHRSRQTLAAALEEWETEMGELRQRFAGSPAARQKAIETWKQQRNPWPAYREQMAGVSGQSATLAAEFIVLSGEVTHFDTLRGLLHESVAAAVDSVAGARRKANEIVSFIAETEESGRPGRVASRLDELIADAGPKAQIHDYTNKVNQQINRIVESQRVTVGADHGVLQFKDVNFRRATDQWVSAEVFPQLYELWEISENLTAVVDMAVNNVRNRALLVANELRAGNEVNYNVEQLTQPFYDFLARADTNDPEFTAVRENLTGLIDADLKLTSVYRPVPGFLPLPLQTGLNEFTRRQGRWLEPIKQWIGATFDGFEQWRGDAVREDKMSTSEKVVRVINQRKPDPANLAYTNIVMTKGYIGESFLVGREEETAHLGQLITNWRAGYRGAVVLTGKRLSGKSLFGEMISNRLFPNNVIRLSPNTTIFVEGRRMVTTGNLAGALAFVEKYTIQSRPMIWIDDLELWWDDDTLLAENVRALATHIDNHSARIFYLVATTNAVYAHLDRYLELDRIFQAEVNLDDFATEDMQRAIRIRHGATHKSLVNQDGEPLSDRAFNRLIAKLHRGTHHNVGDTLNRWAFLMEYCDDDRVTPSSERRPKLPAFLGADTGVLLAAVYLERRTNEYHLRRLFGPAFEARYRNVLQRLLRVGLLTRGNDGWLEIRESVVSDVGRSLEYNGYLKTKE